MGSEPGFERSFCYGHDALYEGVETIESITLIRGNYQCMEVGRRDWVDGGEAVDWVTWGHVVPLSIASFVFTKKDYRL